MGCTWQQPIRSFHSRVNLRRQAKFSSTATKHFIWLEIVKTFFYDCFKKSISSVVIFLSRDVVMRVVDADSDADVDDTDANSSGTGT